MKKRAFTLIELLVVIAIIGILASIVMVSVSGARAKARDAERNSDLRTIKTALELYYSDKNPNAYPNAQAATVVDSSIFGTGQTYIKTVPTDPIAGRSYYYISDSTFQNYVVCANLENDNDGERNTVPSGFTIPTGYCDYYMTND